MYWVDNEVKDQNNWTGSSLTTSGVVLSVAVVVHTYSKTLSMEVQSCITWNINKGYAIHEKSILPKASGGFSIKHAKCYVCMLTSYLLSNPERYTNRHGIKQVIINQSARDVAHMYALIHKPPERNFSGAECVPALADTTLNLNHLKRGAKHLTGSCGTDIAANWKASEFEVTPLISRRRLRACSGVIHRL